MKRDEFIEIQKNVNTILVVFLTASWCKPCQSIKPYILPKLTEYTSVVLDIDTSSEIYSALKVKKQIQGVPTLLAFYPGNISFIPNESISGTNKTEIDLFFKTISSSIHSYKN
jgi:thiol-disulfide isomerase/thioredoxin